MNETKKSIIVVADTHFGLDDGDLADDPKAFADFLKWIKQLEEGSNDTIKSNPWAENLKNIPLRPPEKIILLGDILELWDASNKSIDFSTRYLMQLMSELNCEKIYVLGNHDHELAELRSRYPLGASDLRIIRNEFWVSKGTENYCFLHGHQFDKLFTLQTMWRILPSWNWMVHIRKAGVAFGSYTYVLVALFAGYLVFGLFGGFKGVADIVLLLLLGTVSIPFLIIQFGRKIWNSLKTVKYNPKYARLKALLWKKFPEGHDKKGQNITVVYGHTHAIDFWRDASGDNTITTMNIPSWIRPRKWVSLKDKKSMERELYHAFLYITAEGSEFLGWDTQRKKPYLIPKNIIMHRREDDLLFIQLQNDILQELGWPESLIQKWSE